MVYHPLVSARSRPTLWARLRGLLCVAAPFLFSKAGRARALLGRHDRTFIRDVEPGTTVKIIGKLRPLAEQVTATFSGERCVYSRSEARETVTAPNGHTISGLLAATEYCCDVIIADGTGEAVIRMKQATVNAPQQQYAGSRAWADAFVEASGYPPAGRQLSYSEAVVHDGATVAVLGTAAVEVAGAVVQRTFPAKPNAHLIVSSALEDWIDHALADEQQRG
jgi:hypothetical protein